MAIYKTNYVAIYKAIYMAICKAIYMAISKQISMAMYIICLFLSNIYMAIYVAFDMAIYIIICIAWVPLKPSIRLPILVIYIGHLYDYLYDIRFYKDVSTVIWLST